MRKETKYIVCHCTATSLDAKVESIKNHWKRIGWKNVGYHILIDKLGIAHYLVDDLDQITNGVKGFNSVSVHVSTIGGKDIDDRTEEQKQTLTYIVTMLKAKYPSAKVQGHRDFPNVSKSCPRYDAKVEFDYLNK
jgi:N-acetylmuramoyl-L-alanine amidase